MRSTILNFNRGQGTGAILSVARVAVSQLCSLPALESVGYRQAISRV